MPVFPLLDSRIVWPGRRSPRFSASSTMDSATRSFTLPPGFCPSSLARIRTFGLGLIPLTSTSGVLPIRPRAESYRATSVAGSAAGDGREDRDGLAAGELGVELVEEADVVVVDVDVHELVEVAVLGHDLSLQLRELEDEVLEHLTDRLAVGLDRGLARGVLPQDGGQADVDRHGRALLGLLTSAIRNCSCRPEQPALR